MRSAAILGWVLSRIPAKKEKVYLLPHELSSWRAKNQEEESETYVQNSVFSIKRIHPPTFK
jgi:hypothetical protein